MKVKLRTLDIITMWATIEGIKQLKDMMLLICVQKKTLGNELIRPYSMGSLINETDVLSDK